MNPQTNHTVNQPVTAIIVGAGHRAMLYASLSLSNPELLRIVGVADPDPIRRKKAMNLYGFSDDMCFETAEELAKKGKLADAIINGTMDELHLSTSIPLLQCGYDMLLEKPFAVNEEEMRTLVNCAKENHVRVMICHVLRYAPFYYSIKETISSGVIGDIINIQTSEHVSYHHMSTSYVRGKWANRDTCHTPCCLQSAVTTLTLSCGSCAKPDRPASAPSEAECNTVLKMHRKIPELSA